MEFNKKWDTIIIGAGMAGLSCARELKKQGRKVLVVDKSRGLGGRVATRRREGLRFNHGAQYIMAQDLRFEQLLDSLLLSGILDRYSIPVYKAALDKCSYDNGRFTAIPDMNSLPKYLASDLNLLVNKRVTALRGSSAGWLIITESGDEYLANSIVLTIPVPQATELLENSGISPGDDIAAVLNQIEYNKTIAAMINTNWTKFENLNIDDLAAAGIDLIAPAIDKEHLSNRNFIIHLDQVISERKFEFDNTRIISYLANSLRSMMEFQIENVVIHRWRYSTVKSGIDSGSLTAATSLPLVFAGDAFGRGCSGIETAYLSGLDAAEKLMKIMPDRG